MLVCASIRPPATGPSAALLGIAFAWRRALSEADINSAKAFLSRLWQRAEVQPDDALINLFPLYPSAIFGRHRGPKWFYLDQTLNQAFRHYALAVGAEMAADAMSRERAQYLSAAGVITQSAWAARDVIETYGVEPEKVHVAIPGASIDRDALAAWEAGRAFETRSVHARLRLAFVGKEWHRKGLDRLLRAASLVRARGLDIEVVVVGIDPAGLPPALIKCDGVIWAGFIDKTRELTRFLDIVAACDVGCLLSRSEAGGISLREFCRLGMPTIAPAVGGAPEYVCQGASDLVPPDASDEHIACIIARLAQDRDGLTRRRRIAFEHRYEASWDSTITVIERLVTRSIGSRDSQSLLTFEMKW